MPRSWSLCEADVSTLNFQLTLQRIGTKTQLFLSVPNTSINLPWEWSGISSRLLVKCIAVCWFSVAQSYLTLCDPMNYIAHQVLCPSLSPGACSNSCPSSQWYHPTVSSSVVPFSSCLQSFPASGSFPMSQLFSSGGQSTRASAPVFSVNIRGWFPLGLTGWISLQSKGLERVLSNTTVWKHQFFGAQSSLWSNFHIRTCIKSIPPPPSP